jgi:mono/diheme cytochrome c family protein
MKQPAPTLTVGEMREILGTIWAKQYFGSAGNAARGQRVFEDKHCAACHTGASGAPGSNLAKGKDAYSDIGMISVLWDHGPRMFADMEQKGLAWPRFTGSQMSDLIAYLNSR